MNSNALLADKIQALEERYANKNQQFQLVFEATVRRTRDFVVPADAPDIITTPNSTANQLCGRRFNVISFRWLSPAEV